MQNRHRDPANDAVGDIHCCYEINSRILNHMQLNKICRHNEAERSSQFTAKPSNWRYKYNQEIFTESGFLEKQLTSLRLTCGEKVKPTIEEIRPPVSLPSYFAIPSNVQSALHPQITDPQIGPFGLFWLFIFTT